MKKYILLPIIAAFLFIIYISSREAKPKLVVFIVLDQATPDIINKYDHLFTGGLRWIIDHGINFNNTFHEHAETSTGPGHFSFTSGLYPGTGGIISNSWFSRDINRSWYCVEDTLSFELSDSTIGRSYKNINNTALGDWLIDANPNSKIVSMSGKDRSAVFLGGKNPNIALWDDRNGGYTTSSYYSSSLPDWVAKFNQNIKVATYKDSIWNRILPEEIYKNNTRADNFKGESIWSKEPILPIKFDELKSLNSQFYETPYGDRAMLKLGLEAMKFYKMGLDNDPDILFLGLSAIDGVGHSFGPNSHEQMDNYLRLDKALGDFINTIESKIGTNNTLYLLSSDHGVLELPEYLISKDLDAGRIPTVQRDSLFSYVIDQIDEQLGEGNVNYYGKNFYFNKNLNSNKRMIASNLLKTHLIKIPGIESVLSKEEIVNGDNSKISTRLKNMIHDTKSPDIFLIPKKYWISSVSGTTHGSPYDYDAHIPFFVSRSSKRKTNYFLKVKSVDIAPSLAKILKISFPQNLDGKPISLK